MVIHNLIPICACAVLIALRFASALPGEGLAWGWLGVGLWGLAALVWSRGGGWAPGAVGVAFAFGVVAARSVVPGPDLEGPVQFVGVRVGAALGRAADVRLRDAAGRSQGRVRVRFRSRPPPAGTVVAVFGRAGPVGRALPGAPDPRVAARLAGVRTEVVAWRVAEVPPRGPPRALHDPTGLLRAVTTGDREGLAPSLVARLRRTGTAHLLAISGFHVSVVAGLVGWLVLRLHRSAAVVWPGGAVPVAPLVAGGLAAVGYATLAGSPISAQRATLLLVLAVGGRAFGRRPQLVAILGVVAVVVAVADPAAIATPGFQLSFGAVLGLVTIGERLGRFVDPDWSWPLRWTLRSMIASIAATLGTLPAVAWWFQQWAPLSVFANLVAVPFVGMVIVPLAGVAVLAPDPFSGWAAAMGTAAVIALEASLSPFDIAPWAPAVGPVGALALVAALVIGLRRPLWGLGIGLVVLVGPPDRSEGYRFVFLDVGQGDAIFVQQPGGARWLVDGGRPSRSVLHWLRREGVRHLDVVVVTHGDLDHLGGVLPVIEGIAVGEVWAVDPPASLVDVAREAGVPIRDPPRALWPREAARGNRGSVVLSVGPALLTGDIDADIETTLVQRGLAPHRVLKVAHHGSASSTSAGFLRAVQPVHAVVSAGRANRYGHPDPRVLERLRAAGVTVWRTDQHGTVDVRVRPSGIEVRTR